MAVVTERLAVIIDGRAEGGVKALKSVSAEAGKADRSVDRLKTTMDRAAGKAGGGGHDGLRVALGATAAGFGAVAIGAAAGGFALERFGQSTLAVGIQYQDNLNSMQAVTHATAAQMQQAAVVARDLGNDLDLPATSAADAAAAMVELAKGNLTADEAMQAAKGTLTLAAAAQVDGATAATIQADALNAFNLKASQAGHVSDVLANAANAATGEITDFALGLQASSAVSHQFGISLDDNVTSLALFANAGIKGSDAGTSLKSMLLALASPSDAASAALRELGVEAFDSHGKFVGLRKISEELAVAQHHMSQEAFTAAVSTAFGSDAARAAGVFASQGAKGFDQMAAAVGRAGGASDVAKAKMKGVGGALQGLQSQAETVKIDLFNRNAPDIEAFIRALSDRMPGAADAALSAVDRLAQRAHAAFPEIKAGIDIVGPAIQTVIADKLALLADVAERVLFPALRGVGTVAQAALPALLQLGHVVNDVVRLGLAAAAQVAQTFEANAADLGGVLADLGHGAGEFGRTVLPVLQAGFHLAALAAGALVDAAALIGGVLGPLAGPAAKAAAAIVLVAAAVKGFRAAASGFNSLSNSITSNLDKLTSKAKEVASLETTLSYAPKHAAPAYGKLVSGVRAAATALPILGIGLGVVATELEHNAQQAREATEKYEGLFRQVQLGGQAGKDASRDLATIRDFLAKTGDSPFLADVRAQFDAGQKAADAYQKSLSQTDLASQAVTRASNDVALAISKYGQESPQATAAAQQYNAALDGQRRLEDDVATATRTATQTIIDKTNALLGAANSDVAYRQSQLDTKRSITDTTTAQDAYNKVIAQYGKQSPQATAAQDALTQARLSEEQAIMRQVAAAGTLASDALPATASAEDRAKAAAQAQIRELDRLSKTLSPNDPLRTRLEQYSRRLRDIPAAKRTIIDLRTPNAAGIARELDHLARRRLIDMELRIKSIVENPLGLGHHAIGGAVAAGVPVVVGERRPEVFIPNTSGSIRPSTTASQSGGDSGPGVTLGVLVAALAGMAWQLDPDGLVRLVQVGTLGNRGR